MAWLTLFGDAGQLRYTTVAASDTGGQGLWFADGKEVPGPLSARVVYDPARALREAEADRELLREYKRLLERKGSCESHRRAMPHRTPFTAPGWPSEYELQREEHRLEEAIPLVERLIKARAAVYSDHPEYREAWKP